MQYIIHRFADLPVSIMAIDVDRDAYFPDTNISNSGEQSWQCEDAPMIELLRRSGANDDEIKTILSDQKARAEILVIWYAVWHELTGRSYKPMEQIMQKVFEAIEEEKKLGTPASLQT